MPRGTRTLQASFAGGEMSPEMYSRYDDPRLRSGLARALNYITNPRGAAARRPGFGRVNEVKDSTRIVRFLEFDYSREQNYVLEMSRAVIDSRDIGYFRFHTNGGTLLQPRPPNYREPRTASAISSTTERWTINAASAAARDLQTGDPIVFTLSKGSGGSETATFDSATDEVIVTSHGFQDDSAVLFTLDGVGGAVPPEIEAEHIYYVKNSPSADRFQLMRKRGGQVISFSAGAATTVYVANLPNPVGLFIDCNKTYYAVVISTTEIQIAETRENALAGTPIVMAWTTSIGTVDHLDIRIHYDYRNGDAVIHDVIGDFPFYCRKAPWGTPLSPKVYIDDHVDHPPTNTIYWMRQSGESSSFTVNTTTDRIIWGTHGLSDGDPFTVSSDGTLPSPLVAGTIYYVRNSTAGDFQLSESPNGPVLVNIATAGTGTHTVFANGIYEVPHDFAEDILFEVNTAQSADVLSLVHLDRYPVELRRMGPTRWTIVGINPLPRLGAPQGVEVDEFRGEGLEVVTTTATTAPTPTVIQFFGTVNHGLTTGQKVMVENVIDPGGPTVLIPDGHYIVDTFVGGSHSNTTCHLKEFESGNYVASPGGNTGAPMSAARIRPSDYIEDWNDTYVVTALTETDEESPPSAEAPAVNNLLVAGAQNTISWEPVAGAQRYRIYKAVDGLFGFIGETDAPTTSFLDENIGPDLSITPPLIDASMLKSAFITFDTPMFNNTNSVIWPAHELEAGAAVLFDTNDDLPPGLTYGVTYYVINPSENAFQLTADPTSETVINLDPSTTWTYTGYHVGISGAWPAAVAYFEQRRIFAGARLQPQDFWMTVSGTERDLSYHIPVKDSDRIYNRIAARKRSQIRHAVPAGNLLLLTDAAEYRLTSFVGEPLTPGTVSARAPTQVGAKAVAPVLVNNVVLFAASRGGHLREMGFYDQVNDYITGDLSLRAIHLFDSREIVQMAYHQAPNSVVWVVTSAGTLLGLTYIPEEQVVGWHEHQLADGGLIESVAVVAEGMEDRVYIVANRGGTRTVERMGSQYVDAIEDVFFVDEGSTYEGAPATTLFLPHLAGREVVYLADGIKGSGTVSAGGTLTLATAASTVQVGIPYTSELHTIPLGIQVDGALGTGRPKNVNEVYLQLVNSGALEIGSLPAPYTVVDSPEPDAGTLFNGRVQVTQEGDWTEEAQIVVRQSDPLPGIITALTMEVAIGG